MNKEKRDRLYAVLCTVLTIVFISVMLFTVEKMPDLGRADNPDINEVMEFYVEEGPEETGALNAVTGMILHYRAFDTLGESCVLFVSAVASDGFRYLYTIGAPLAAAIGEKDLSFLPYPYGNGATSKPSGKNGPAS